MCLLGILFYFLGQSWALSVQDWATSYFWDFWHPRVELLHHNCTTSFTKQNPSFAVIASMKLMSWQLYSTMFSCNLVISRQMSAVTRDAALSGHIPSQPLKPCNILTTGYFLSKRYMFTYQVRIFIDHAALRSREIMCLVASICLFSSLCANPNERSSADTLSGKGAHKKPIY